MPNYMLSVPVTLTGRRNLHDDHGFRKFYGTYEELAGDPEVDVVYIASPHSHHRDQAITLPKE